MELEKQIQNILSMHRRLSPSITHHHPSSPISIHHHHHRHHHHLHHLIIIIIHHHPSYIIQKVWGCALAISIAAWPLERRKAAAFSPYIKRQGRWSGTAATKYAFDCSNFLHKIRARMLK